jgi:hypothetical protein
MLKRGNNRPAFPVLLAEARTQQGIAKTFGRSVMQRKAPCPFPACRAEPEPLFCATHWGLLGSFMRRELLTELRIMRDRKQGTPTPTLRELFKVAIRDMQKALAKAAPPT